LRVSTITLRKRARSRGVISISSESSLIVR